MKFFLGILWVLATCSLFYFGHDHYLCSIRGLCVENQEIVKPAKEDKKEIVITEVPDFIINDQNQPIYYFNGSPLIQKGVVKITYSDTLGSIKDSVFSYLSKRLDKNVLVTVFYDPDFIHLKGNEGVASTDSSFAASRLNALVNSFVRSGVNKDKIIRKLVVKKGLYSSDTIYNGIEINFESISEDVKLKIDNGISHKTLYSAFGKGEFKPDNTLENYASELKDYLDRYPSKKVTVTGHTDDIGKSTANYKLGLIRAQNVAKYLVKRGVSKEKITSTSEGEKSPVDPTKTDQARKLNRRIEVIVK